jgi:archaetidylinositol phosphate synthase
MLTKLKERFQSWIAAEAKLAHSLGFTPNQISAVGVVFAAFSALAYWNWRSHPLYLILAPIFLLASGFCDALDGALARMRGQITAFGGFLDSLLDRYAEAIVFFGIILGGLCDPLWGLVALIGSLLVSYARARAEAAGVKMETVGVAERAERLLILAIASFLSLVRLEALSWAVILLSVLTHLTVLQRIVYFRKASRQKEK